MDYKNYEIVSTHLGYEDHGIGTKVSKIGHLMDDKWLDFESFFKEVDN